MHELVQTETVSDVLLRDDFRRTMGCLPIAKELRLRASEIALRRFENHAESRVVPAKTEVTVFDALGWRLQHPIVWLHSVHIGLTVV